MGVICIEVEHQIVPADDLGKRRCVYRKQLGGEHRALGNTICKGTDRR